MAQHFCHQQSCIVYDLVQQVITKLYVTGASPTVSGQSDNHTHVCDMYVYVWLKRQAAGFSSLTCESSASIN